MAVKQGVLATRSRERSLLGAGTALSLLGIALATGDSQTLAFALAGVGVLITVIGLHRFGRTGADQPRVKRKRAA